MEEVRKLYQDQVSGLEDLHAQVREGLDHLRLETTHLQRIEETIRQQREALGAGFQEFEQKQALFQVKGQSRFILAVSALNRFYYAVQEALTEATDVLMRHGPVHKPLSNTDG